MGLGLLSTVLLLFLVPLLTVVLLVIVIGIPFILLLYLLLWLFYLTGLSIAGLALGQVLYAQMKRRYFSRWLPPILGLIILVPLTILPGVAVSFLGLTWVLLVPSIGLGAIVLSRVGTMTWAMNP
jgi:hypothetical protein